MVLSRIAIAVRAAIASIKPPPAPGVEDGEKCNRDGCQGTITMTHDDAFGGCSCFIVAPCSYCMSSYNWCPVCGWDDQG